jgi:hypothetical protein
MIKSLLLHYEPWCYPIMAHLYRIINETTVYQIFKAKNKNVLFSRWETVAPVLICRYKA